MSRGRVVRMLAICGCVWMWSPGDRGRIPLAAQTAGVGGNCKFPIRGNRKPHTLVVGGLCPAFHDVGESNSEGAGANARMGDEDAAEALSATGRLEGRVGETLRGEPPDDPRMGRDGSVGPGTCRQGVRATRHVQPCPTSWLPTPGSSRHVSRSSPVCRRSVCSTRSARRATPVATAVCGTTSARYARASRSRRWCGSRRRRGVRARWTSRRSRCPGAAGTPWWWC